MTSRREILGGLVSMMALGKDLPNGWPEKVFQLKEGKTSHESYGELTVFFDGPTGELKTMVAGTLVLNPGMEPHPPHQHPEEEFMLVTEGNGEIFVDGQINQVGPGSLMFSHSNQLHGIKNTSAAPMRFYYFKWAK